jgi:hypothetical protein
VEVANDDEVDEAIETDSFDNVGILYSIKYYLSM